MLERRLYFHIDWLLIAAIGALCAIGLTMIYSTTGGPSRIYWTQIYAIGLGIGAMFVRSLTIMLVEQGTLTSYRYLEHGAFYAIIALGVIMFLKTIMHVPEAVTGLIGAAFIGLSFYDSVRHNRRQAALARQRR